MSWQCHICENVNLDTTPYCAVCDTLAPVIEAYLSIQSIEGMRAYNDKLKLVNTYETNGDLYAMLQEAIEAIALCTENGLAIDKAKQAIKRLTINGLLNNIKEELEKAIKGNDYNTADALIHVAKILSTDYDEDITLAKRSVIEHLNIEREVGLIMLKSRRAIMNSGVEEALKIITDAIISFPDNEILAQRKEEILAIKKFISSKKTKSLVKGTITLGTTTKGTSTDGNLTNVSTLGKRPRYRKK